MVVVAARTTKPCSKLRINSRLRNLLDGSTTWAACVGMWGAGRLYHGGAYPYSALRHVLDRSNTRLLARWGQYQGILLGILGHRLVESMSTILWHAKKYLLSTVSYVLSACLFCALFYVQKHVVPLEPLLSRARLLHWWVVLSLSVCMNRSQCPCRKS